jgi:hypothetical protein
MSKKFYILLASFIITASVFAQAPEKMSYQAVVRDADNALVTNQQIGMQIIILQGATAVYVETQTPTSNTNGLVSLKIGEGTVISGLFTAINWSIEDTSYFIKTETDPTGGTDYTITGTSQLLSVPYALYAKTSGSSTPGPQGETGTQGEIGATGATGTQGIQGETGTYTEPTYFLDIYYPELGGYVIEVSVSGKHGIVAAMQDQGTTSWYSSNNLLSDPTNHDTAGAEFKDWRLPTLRELNLIYSKRDEIGGFTSTTFWSSTEDDVNDAWIQDFDNGNQDFSDKNYIYNSVRAVRFF